MATVQILLLERDPALRGLLEDICAEDGFNVRICETLPEVGSAMTGLPGQVVLVDDHYIDGAVDDDLRCELKRLGTLVPIVMLSSCEHPHTILDGDGMSMVPMPFDVDELLSAIHAAIGPRAETLLDATQPQVA